MKKISIHINTLGLLCPQPIIETAKKIKTMRPGQVLEILTDDWGMIPDLPAWCKSTGNPLLEIKDEKTFLRCNVLKKS